MRGWRRRVWPRCCLNAPQGIRLWFVSDVSPTLLSYVAKATCPTKWCRRMYCASTLLRSVGEDVAFAGQTSATNTAFPRKNHPTHSLRYPQYVCGPCAGDSKCKQNKFRMTAHHQPSKVSGPRSGHPHAHASSCCTHTRMRLAEMMAEMIAPTSTCLGFRV